MDHRAVTNPRDNEPRRSRVPLPDDGPDEATVRMMRGMTGAERLALAGALFSSARSMLCHHLASQHPEWDEEKLQRETSRRISHGAV
jgi:hypothetical protein